MNQKDYWNGEAGAKWAAEVDRLDAMLAPFGDAVVAALGPELGMKVLDIGCGAGATSRAVAAKGAGVVGVDISAPLVQVAQSRGGGPEYHCADAGADPLPGPFDAALSRFGVMFFEDPRAAFSHIRAAMAADARLAFICWRTMQENPWMSAPLAAALPHLSEPPPLPDPGAPGPFAFADPDHVSAILRAAGWDDVSFDAYDGRQTLGATLDEAVYMAVNVGPLGALLRDQPAAREPAKAAARDCLAAAADAAGAISFPNAAWIVTARA